MVKSTEVSPITPTYDPSTDSWVYQDDDGNTVTVDPVHGPPVPKFDFGTCQWIDEVSGLAFIEAVNGDTEKMPKHAQTYDIEHSFYHDPRWVDQLTHHEITPSKTPGTPHWDYEAM